MMFKGNANQLTFEPKEGDEVLLEDVFQYMNDVEIIKFM